MSCKFRLLSDPLFITSKLCEDFMLALAGSGAGAAFGKGIYFAEDCLKVSLPFASNSQDIHIGVVEGNGTRP
eukprot:1854117-Amphidinium_carterae.2